MDCNSLQYRHLQCIDKCSGPLISPGPGEIPPSGGPGCHIGEQLAKWLFTRERYKEHLRLILLLNGTTRLINLREQ